MGTPFDSNSFCNGLIVSGKLWDYEYFLITVLFVKTKEMPVKKFAFLLRPITTKQNKNLNRSRRVWVDQNDMKFVLCPNNCFFQVYYALKDFLPSVKKSNTPWYKNLRAITQILSQTNIIYFNKVLQDRPEQYNTDNKTTKTFPKICLRI